MLDVLLIWNPEKPRTHNAGSITAQQGIADLVNEPNRLVSEIVPCQDDGVIPERSRRRSLSGEKRWHTQQGNVSESGRSGGVRTCP